MSDVGTPVGRDTSGVGDLRHTITNERTLPTTDTHLFEAMEVNGAWQIHRSERPSGLSAGVATVKSNSTVTTLAAAIAVYVTLTYSATGA